MKLTKKEVEKIGRLARIGLSKKDVEKYRGELSSVLSYFQKLEEVDTEGVATLGHAVGLENVFRKDELEKFDDEGKEIMKKNMPDEKKGFYKVKSVL